MQSDRLRRQLTATNSNRLPQEEINQFLSERHVGYLGTASRAGQVHLTPIWFWYENESASFVLGTRRVHLANLRVSPNATLLVSEDLRPIEGWQAYARAVMIKGVVTQIEDPGEFARLYSAMERKYLGDDADDPGYREAEASDTNVMWCLAKQPTLSWKLGG
jgi:nitroimidazol reductase NimA-like FMN-containing flavoprotein (pyridoxamine 5'-phosphate oxidase superfamily)